MEQPCSPGWTPTPAQPQHWTLMQVWVIGGSLLGKLNMPTEPALTGEDSRVQSRRTALRQH